MNIDTLILKPLPYILLELLKFDALKKESSIRELERIVSIDKDICSELLRLSNSSFYRRSGTIGEIREAITLIGLVDAKNVILMLAMKSKSLKLDPKFNKYLNYFPDYIIDSVARQRFQLENATTEPDVVKISALSKIIAKRYCTLRISLEELIREKLIYHSYILSEQDKTRYGFENFGFLEDHPLLNSCTR